MRKTNEQNSKHKIPNTNNGITLIALVITIIVMLILVAVTISMAVNGGLFDYAGTAVGETQNEIEKEQLLAEGKIEIDGTWYNSIDEYVKGTGDIVGVDGEIFSAIYEKTEEYEDSNGDIAVIPKGFSVGKSSGINTIQNGLVIQDEAGNQYVWIPVEVTEDDTETSIKSFYRSLWSNNERTTGLSAKYKEPYEYGYEEEVAEYNEMVKSVYNNKGFYIGRYEAGTTTVRTGEEDGTTNMVIKRDAYPYNYVGWGATASDYISDFFDDYINGKNQGKGSAYLSKKMYDGKDVDVTSTLCYGIQWDAMLDFIKDVKNVTDSTSWGNYSDNLWTIDRGTAQYSDDYGVTWQKISDLENNKLTKEESTTILLTTGAEESFVAKNIYDIAGNCTEFTMEYKSGRVGRGRRHGIWL